jgi:hypothetical protein
MQENFTKEAQVVDKKKLTGVVEIFRSSFLTYKKNFSLYVGILAIPFLFSLILLVLTALIENFELSGLWVILSIVVLILFSLGLFVLNIYAIVALMYAISKKGEEINLKKAYQEARKRLFPFAWLYFLTGFIALGGYMLFFIPGLVISIWFFFGIYLLFVEEEKGINALLKSREYVRNLWWSVFWRILFLGLVVILSFILTAFIFDFLGVGEEITASLFSLFVSPLIFIYGFTLLDKIKELKGDVHLEISHKKRIPYILIGVLGAVIFPIIIGFLVLNALQDAGDLAKRVTVMSQMSILRSNAEIVGMQEEGYKSFDCTHEDASLLCEEIKEQTGIMPIIQASDDAYCMYVKINDENYFCIDSDFNTQEVKTYPGKEGFCDGETFVCPQE